MLDNWSGLIIWLSGAPGMGKSTSAQILARTHGYVYYEADCFMALKNPYVPLNVANPSLAQLSQKPLKGAGMEERKKGRDYAVSLVKGSQYMEFFTLSTSSRITHLR